MFKNDRKQTCGMELRHGGGGRTLVDLEKKEA